MIRRLHALLCICVGMMFSELANAQLNAAFTANVVSGCAPLVVQFTDQSTGNPTSWNWDLGNGTSSNLPTPSTLYLFPGVYTVRLIVSNSTGSDTMLMTNYINVIPSPTPAISISDSGAFCPPKSIQFTNLSTANSPGAAQYYWDFGDGFTSTQVSPNHVYTSTGTFSVTMSITNSAGCTRVVSKPNFLQIFPKPTAGFSSINNNSCSYPVNVNFTNTSTGATSYLWNFGDGGTSTAINPSHNYTTPGSYTVSLVATNASNCRDTMTVPVFVNVGVLNPNFTKSATSVCKNTPVIFTNTSTPSGSLATWYFGDGTSATGNTVSHAYANAGTYTVKMVADLNGCQDSTTQTITVTQAPTASFTATNPVSCSVPFSVPFNNSSTGNPTGYLWIFGDGNTSTATNPTHSYTTYGNFNVTLVAYGANGCNDTITQSQLVVITPGLMGIIPATDSGCVPKTITFGINWTYPVANLTSYTWNFGDGTTLTTSANPVTHTYTVPGTYTVSATALSSGGCGYASNNSTTIVVGTVPNVNFTAPDSTCPSETVQFTNTSNGNNPAGYSYTWKFGDGTSSNQISPNHIYYTQGTYNVTLIIESNGCKDSITRQILVNPPAAFFTPIFSCTNRKEVTFVNSSTGGSLYRWDFGDGDTSILHTPPPHTYAAYGSYNVMLRVTHLPSMCISVNSAPVLLFDLDAQFSASDTVLCKNDTTLFTAVPSQYIAQYYWDFGDGTSDSSSTNTKSHKYTASGLYTVRLIVKDIRGCLDTMVRTNYIVVSGPTAIFNAVPTSGCAPLTVNFTDASNGDGSAITSRIWYFGDGTINSQNVTNIVRTYPRGVYTVSLKITNATGCSDSIAKVNYINSIKPTASFTANPTMICPNDTVFFTNNSITNNINNPSLSYVWDFGDGNTSTATSPYHVYTVTGNYTVRLIVSDGPCKDTLTRVNYINVGGTNLSFTASDTFSSCPPLTVNFVNTSTIGNNFVWMFGNGNGSTLNNPSAVYVAPGVYTVKLAGQNGICYDTVSKTITVVSPTGNLSYAPLAGCAPHTVTFTATNVNTPLLVWDMNNGVTITTTTGTLSYTYTQPGNYVPKMLLSNGAGCIVPIIGTDTIRVSNLQSDFSFSPNTLCRSGAIQFLDTIYSSSAPVTARSWTFGDGGTSTAHNPLHNYAAPGTYTVRLITSTNTGCHDTVTKTVTVFTAPNVTASGGATICQGSNTPVQLQASGAQSYTWSSSASLSCNTCSNPTVLPTATSTFTVIGVDSNGCSDTAQTTVTVAPLPTIMTGPSATICAGGSVQLAASGAATYTWAPAGSLSCTTCPNPNATPATTTTFTVTGTSVAGCSNTGQITVTVEPIPTVSASASDSTLCVGDTTFLLATGATTYQWSPAAGLSCTNCPNPVAVPTTTTTYTVTGAGPTGCSDTAFVTIIVNPLPIVSAASQSVCSGFSGQFVATGASTYTWTPATGLSCSNCPNPIVTPQTTTTYTITGVSAAGCLSTGQTTVTVNQPPVLSVSGNQTICNGDAVALNASGAASYTWSPATGLSCTNCPNPNASPTTTTTYTVIGTDANGCRDTGRVTVTVNPLPVVDAGPDQFVCNLNSAMLQATGASQYTWSPAATLSCTNCPNPTAAPTGPTTYTVIGTDQNGCSNSDNVTVNIFPQPTITATGDTTICEGASVQLQAFGASSYLWTPAAGLSCVTCYNPIAKPSATTVYSVVGTDGNGCRDSTQVKITLILKQPFVYGPDDTLCEGQSVELYAAGGDSYTWSPKKGLSSTNSNTTNASPDETTTYTIIIKQGKCFADTGNITVTVYPNPTVNAGPDHRIVAGQSVRLVANGTHTDFYKWSPPNDLSCTECAAPLATPKETTTYKVVASNRFGCLAEDEVTIFISCDNSQVFIPNTFTPNGDGLNDRFYLSGSGIAVVDRIRVYNRWGELIWETRNIQAGEELKGWDGTYKGEPLTPDVYVYIVDATCLNGTPMQLKGDISLIR